MTSADPYSSNPFRVLGLLSTCSGREAARSADRLLKWLELGEIPNVEDPLPYLGLLPRDREQVKKAAKDIENPRIRIASELYWPSPTFSAFDTCQEFLQAGRYGEFVAHCEKVIADGFAGRKNHKDSDPRLDACLGCHYLAVFYHSAAMAASRTLSVPVSLEKPPISWEQAFRYWKLVMNDEFFWTHLGDRVRCLNDPRANASYVQDLKREVPSTLLRVNVSRAVASVEDDQIEELVRNCHVIKEAQFGPDGDQALTEVSRALQTRFDRTLHEIQSSMSESTIRMHVPRTTQSNADQSETPFVPAKLAVYLAAVEDSVNKTLVPIGNSISQAGIDHTEIGCDVLDNLAYAYRSISLAFNNFGGMPLESLRLTTAAKEFARSTMCKEQLDEDYQALQFISLKKIAAELAAASRYRESLSKLQEARQYAASDEERKTIDEWIEVARTHVAFDGVKKIDRAPDVLTFYGIGTMLYGRRNDDPHTQSYEATLYFTFIFIPILPLAAYRVRNAGGGQYFLGKVPVTASAFVIPAIVAVVIAFFIIANSMQTATSPSSSIGIATPGQTTSADRDSLGQWIDQERSRLNSQQTAIDAEQTAIASEAAQIETDRASLNQRFNVLNAGSPSQGDVDNFEADRLRFNKRVQAFKARFAKNQADIKKYQADVKRFNAQVARYNSMP